MSEEIVNRVANSKLVTIDLEEYYPKGKRVLFDIKDWLYQGLILREKEFRASVSSHDWIQYKECYIALTCSSEAIIPSWAYLLITTKLATIVEKVVVGNLNDLEISIFEDVIKNIDTSIYNDKPVIVKGCSTKPIPTTAYTLLIKKLQPYVKSLMYGEACSSVPLYKKPK